MTTNGRIPVRLRAFRKFAEETKNHDLERDLYIEERKAERGVKWRQLLDGLKKAPEELKKHLEDINNQKKHAWLEWRLQAMARAHRLGIALKIARLFTHLLWITVMFFYWALADYGRSFVWLLARAFLLLALWKNPLAAGEGGPVRHGQIRACGGNAGAWQRRAFHRPLAIDSEVKKFLFCAGDVSGKCLPVPPEGYQWLVIGS